jgi:hypothetical protein
MSVRAAPPGTDRGARPDIRAALIAVTVFVAAAVVGALSGLAGHPVHAGAAPLFGHWLPHAGPVSRCCDFQASHFAATCCLSAGTVADGAGAAWGSCGAGVSGPQAGGVVRPAVSEVRLGSAMNGVKFVFWVNAARIGLAALSFWFIGWIPRICSMVRIIVICE